MKIKDLCESERPREKMLSSGGGSLSNGELLAILLRSGNHESSALDLAQQLLNLSGGHLCELFNMSADKMRSLPGIGPGKAATVIAAFELGKRFLQEEASVVKKSLASARMVFDLMIPQLKGVKHEECWTLLLNDSNYLVDKVKATSGGGNSTVLDVRQIVRLAIDKNASGIILLHNHPSGNPHPSKQDIEQTKALRKAAEACGLRLLDHIVLADDCFYSFADERSYSV